MPVGRKYDFQLNGLGYLLQRGGAFRGRAWSRTGVPDTPSRRSDTDRTHGELPDTLDHPEVWDDWSGGFGDAYRDKAAGDRYHWAENFDARWARQLVHAQRPWPGVANGPADGFLEVPYRPSGGAGPAGLGSVLEVRAGSPVWATPLAQLAVDEVANNAYSGNFVGRGAVFGSFAYVGRLQSDGFARLGFDGAATTAPVPGRGFVVAAGRLWRWHGPAAERNFYLQSCAIGADPLATANWSATLSVGDGRANVADALSLDDRLYLGLANGLYAGDQSGTFVNVLPELAGQTHPDNARDLCAHQGEIVVPALHSLYAYRPDTGGGAGAREIGPQRGSSRSPLRGRIRCVESSGRWLYAGLYTGSQSYLLAGRETGRGWAWHPQARLPGVSRVHRLRLDGITAASGTVGEIPRRLWVASDASVDTGGTAPVYYVTVPRGDDNPLGDTQFTANYVGSARIDLGIVDGGAPGTPKVYRAVEVWSENLTGTAGVTARWADVYYTIDGGTRTLLGTVATSPKATLYFPSTAGSFTTGQSIELSLESFTKAGAPPFTVSPVYRSIVLRHALRPKSVDTITAVARIADGLKDRQGTPLRSGAQMLAELRALAEQESPVTLVDLAGARNVVQVLAPVEEQEAWQQGEEEPEVAAIVRMAVLEFSGG